MINKYNACFANATIEESLIRLVNLTYKLLPMREENENWQKTLETIIEELSGMDRVLIDQHDILFPLLCKLEGLFLLNEEESFSLYRRTIFECISLINELKKRCQV